MHLTYFVLLLYDIGHMVKNHSDSERGNPLLLLDGLLFEQQQMVFYTHHPTDRLNYPMTYIISVVDHWVERKVT